MVKDKNIEIENLSQTKDNKKILDNINLSIPINKVVCLVGPSGCGKTSLLRAISGLDNFSSGRISFDNKIISKPNYSVPTENRNIGLVFQESNLFPHLNVFKNVSFGSKKKKYKDIQKETFEILKKIGLPHYANVYPHQLSGGQKQLVAIARSLLTKPKLIMMDEPFANLDERLKNKIRDITLHLLQKTFTTALIITHDPDDAMFMGDFIAIMNNGKILQFDTPENIYNNPSSSFVARFFGETLSIKSKVNNKKAKTIFGPINITNSKNGKEIEIVFRSEAFNITKNKSKNRTKKIKSRIIAVRYISDNSYLHLDILNNSFKKHIHIKVPGKFIPPKNKICYINIGKKNFFVF
ncbi:MAG: ABC transporter ATP-binding protein [Alphaproteobacteria bacterium]|nr:ABC transporter ATP-binding protein [Alphaproteobacteria bacterium]